MGWSLDYILYELEWHVYQECYNWLLMYIHGYKREVMGGKGSDGMKYKLVYDEANMNWIDYVEAEKDNYTWMPTQDCFWLRAKKEE